MNAVLTDSRHDQVEPNYISYQSGQGDGRRINTDASYRSHGGGGGTDFRDQSVTINGSLSKINASKQLKLAPLETEPRTKTQKLL